MMENFVKGCTFLFLFSFFQATKEDCFKDWLSLKGLGKTLISFIK